MDRALPEGNHHERFLPTRFPAIIHRRNAAGCHGRARPGWAADAPRAGAGAFDFNSKPVPLPFDAKSLNGISEKLIQSHWANNYSGAVAR